MRYEDVPIKQIKIGKRAREDLGDIQGLADTFLKQDSRGHPVGILEPLLLDGRYNLLAGGRRYAAAELAQMDVLPCLIRETTTKLDAYEIELIENMARKDMTWQELAALEKKIFDYKCEHDPNWTQQKQAEFMENSKGATNRRIQLAEALELLPELAEEESEDAAWKTYKKLEENVIIGEMIKKTPTAISEGSKWADDHYIVGDAMALMKKVNAGIADFAEVDPPFGVDIKKVKGRNKDKKNLGTYNEVDADEYEPFYEAVAKEVFRILKDGTFAVFWFGPTWWHETLSVLRKVGFSVPDIAAVWTKGASGQTASPDTNFGSSYEPFWLARKGNAKLAKPGRSNVFDFKTVAAVNKIHATEKPIALLEEIISCCCTPGSTIICPFLGSGVTLRAAYKQGHVGFGYDLNKEHKEAFLRTMFIAGGGDKEPEPKGDETE